LLRIDGNASGDLLEHVLQFVPDHDNPLSVVLTRFDEHSEVAIGTWPTHIERNASIHVWWQVRHFENIDERS
jgi:hypothetical protein